MHISQRKKFIELDDERRNLIGLADYQKAVICLGDPQPKSPGIYTITGPIVELDEAQLKKLLMPILQEKLADNAAKLAEIGVEVESKKQ